MHLKPNPGYRRAYRKPLALSAANDRSPETGSTVRSHDALTGHAGSGAGRAYGSGVGLRVLVEEGSRIEARGAIRGLSWANALVP